MDFQACLKKYGVNFEVKLLSWHGKARPNRNGKKGTHVIFHTEGLATQIPGTADRDIFNYLNGLTFGNWIYAHAYINFSGKFYIYEAIENGCNGTANELDDDFAFQIELQDNGRYNDPKTYTEAQYDTWKRVYCAIKEFYKGKYGTELKFENSRQGGMDHRQVSGGRTCPGAFDGSRVFREAEVLWNQVNKPKPTELEKLQEKYNKLAKENEALVKSNDAFQQKVIDMQLEIDRLKSENNALQKVLNIIKKIYDSVKNVFRKPSK